MKETYRIKPPKHISIGDPWYYEKYKGADLQRLTVDFLVPRHLSSARVMIEETPFDDMPEVSNLNMTICLAPKRTIDTYLGGMYYEGQECKERPLTVDTAKYMINVDGREKTIYTAADGIWGSITEYSHRFKGFDILDAVVIQVGFSDEVDTFESMKEQLKYLFENVKQIENVPTQVQEDAAPIMGEQKM